MNQFLVHALPGSVLVVDISDVGPNTRTVPSHLFDSWKEAERHFLTRTIRHALEQLSAKGSVTKAGDEFVVEAEREGASARELNRTFLSALRKVEKRTTLRAEWTSDDGTSDRFFDYVLKKTIKN